MRSFQKPWTRIYPTGTMSRIGTNFSPALASGQGEIRGIRVKAFDFQRLIKKALAV